MLIENAVQPPRLIGVTSHAVFNALGCIAHEVVCLTLHGADTGVLEVQPICHFVVLASTLRVRDLVVLVILLGKVGEDAARFEQTNLLTIRERVGQSRNAAIGVDLKEPAKRN